MDFTPGQFKTLKIINSFHFGALEMDFRQGQVLEYDGTLLRVGSNEYNAPQLISAIRAGWLQLEGAEPKAITPQPIEVRPAQSIGNTRGDVIVIEAAQEDERVVGSIEDRAKARKQANATYNAAEETPRVVVESRESEILEVEYPGVGDEPPAPTKPKFEVVASYEDSVEVQVIKTFDQKGTNLEFDKNDRSQTPDENAGVPVAKLGSPVQKTMIKDDKDVTSELDRLDSPNPVKITPPVKESKFKWDNTKGRRIDRIQKAAEKYGNDPVALAKITEIEGAAFGKRVQDIIAKKQ